MDEKRNAELIHMDADPFNADWTKMGWDISVKEPRAVARRDWWRWRTVCEMSWTWS